MAKQFTRTTKLSSDGPAVEWTETREESISEAISAGHFKDEAALLDYAYGARTINVQGVQRRKGRKNPADANSEMFTKISDSYTAGVIERGEASKGTIDASLMGLSKKQVQNFRDQGFVVVNAPGE